MERLTGMIGAAGGHLSGHAKTAKSGATEAASSVYGKTPDILKDAAGKAKEVGGHVGRAAYEKGKDAAALAMEKQQEAIAAVSDHVQHKTAEYKKLLELVFKRKMHRYLGQVVDKIPGIIKHATLDPDMPEIVQRGKDSAIDQAWPDFRQEIMWEFAVLLDGKEVNDEDMGAGPDCIRAYFRYHIYPFDKTFWGHLRDPVWVIFTLVSLVPWAGMCPLIYTFLFLIVDKSDEYQLVQFILQFKGTQFISHGIIRMMIGFFLYVNCASAPADPGAHNCAERGPGMSQGYDVIVGGWVVQVFLIWLAFFMIPCSKDKGRSQLHGAIQHDNTGTSDRAGGYIRYLLIYDIVCFILCCAAMAYILSTRHWRYKDWPVKHAFYAVQVVYGFTSTPFFFFTLPLLQAVLTHTVPTAYDREGRCRKFTGPPLPPREPITLPSLISMEDARQLSDKAYQIFKEGKTATALFANWKDEEDPEVLGATAVDIKAD